MLVSAELINPKPLNPETLRPDPGRRTNLEPRGLHVRRGRALGHSASEDFGARASELGFRVPCSLGLGFRVWGFSQG